MTGYIIVFDYQGSQRFWSGKKWVADPSDAEEYTSEDAAVRAFRQVSARTNLRNNEACLVHQYGFRSERVIEWSRNG